MGQRDESEKTQPGRDPSSSPDSEEEIATPLDAYRDVVRSDWIDHNRHLNMGYYVVVFDFATDAFLDYIGLTQEYKSTHGVMTFSLESHVTYRRELREGDELRFTTQLLDFDEKRFHYFHQMYHAREGYLAATNELLSLHVSEETRRSAPMAPEIRDRLEKILRAHRELPTPPQVGRVMGLKATPTT
jgi:acyl-CoA thioester hydrolase